MKLIVSNLEALWTYVTREFYYLMTDLMTTYGWKQIEARKLWNACSTVEEKLLEEFGELPDTILFSEVYEFMHEHRKEIDRLKCSKFFFTDDLHCFSKQMREMKTVSFTLCDTIFST